MASCLTTPILIIWNSNRGFICRQFTSKSYFCSLFSWLYSAIRLSPDKQGYDVPVRGVWITIAVVAERGQIKFTLARVKIEVKIETGTICQSKFDRFCLRLRLEVSR